LGEEDPALVSSSPEGWEALMVTFDRPTLRHSMTVCGPRAADDVWDRYMRPRRWPEWSPQIRSVDYPAETLDPQTTGVVHGPAALRASFRILDVTATGPIRSWAWSVSAAGVELDLVHVVEATPAGTRTVLTMHGFAPAVLLYLPAARFALYTLVH
jgi:hypothetical protein